MGVEKLDINQIDKNFAKKEIAEKDIIWSTASPASVSFRV